MVRERSWLLWAGCRDQRQKREEARDIFMRVKTSRNRCLDRICLKLRHPAAQAISHVLKVDRTGVRRKSSQVWPVQAPAIIGSKGHVKTDMAIKPTPSSILMANFSFPVPQQWRTHQLQLKQSPPSRWNIGNISARWHNYFSGASLAQQTTIAANRSIVPSQFTNSFPSRPQ